jgi:hypothetical protein
MAGNRTLKLSILGDVDNLRKSLDSGSKDVQTFGDKISNFSKVAGAAFAAAGIAAAAYAGKLAIDGVKAAIEDEAAQAKLATTLKNVTGATTDQIKAVEDQILKTSLLTGTTDEELRPSLDRLLRSTKDVEEAQKLQNLALNIAAGTGKDLGAVSEALGKAYDGNLGALKRLGVGIDDNIIKSKDFDAAAAALALTFADQATVQAETFAGKMDRLKVAFDEGKETVGAFILDAITPLVTFITESVVPIIQELSTNIGENLTPVFTDLSVFFKESLIPIIKAWWEFLTKTVIPGITKTVEPIIKGLFKAFDSIATAIKDNEENLTPLYNLFVSVAGFISKTLAPALGTVLGTALQVVGKLVSGLVSGFSKLVGLISDVVDGIKAIINLVKNNPLVRGISGVIDNIFGGGRAAGGPVNAGTTYLVGEKGPELFTPSNSGNIIPNNRLGGASGGNTININVSGAIDPVGVARQIASILNREATTSGAFANLGLSRVVAG